MMSDDLHQRCIRALRQRNAQNPTPLSEAAISVIARKLIAIVPARRLDRLTETIITNYLKFQPQVQALIDPDHPGHDEQWQIALQRIRYIARLRGFSDTGDSAIELEDLVQTIANEFHQSLARYSYESTLETWLHSVTIRQLHRFRRDRSAAKRSAVYEPFERAELVPDPADDEAYIHGLELSERIKHILERQKDGKRLAKVFFLHALADCSTETIGKLIGRHPSRVRALLTLAREALRRELGEDHTDLL